MAASVFSAWGMMMSDLRRDYFVTQLIDLSPPAAEKIESVFADTEQIAKSTFDSEGIDQSKVSFLRYGKFRYQNQEHTTEVLIEGEITPQSLEEIADKFHQPFRTVANSNSTVPTRPKWNPVPPSRKSDRPE